MRETPDIQFGRKASVILPDDVCAELRATRSGIKRQSALVWGEHCTECAFPACYSTCTFYTPRRDGHCRRFVAGIETLAVAEFNLMRIAFRRWGKLESRGPVKLLSPGLRDALHWTNEFTASVTARAPRQFQEPVKLRWTKLLDRLTSGETDRLRQSHFIVEIFAVADEKLTLSFLSSGEGESGIFQRTLDIRRGYNRFITPAVDIMAGCDLGQWHLVQIEPVSGEETAPMIFGIVDFCLLSEQMVESRPVAEVARRPMIKVVVWDLDNTLWDGTLVEDGVDGVRPRDPSLAVVKSLDARGIVNSIASKNDRALAMEALQRFGLADYFVFPQISWGPKSEALREIARAMDIGLDTMAFVDDQPFERGEVGELVPEVEVFADSEAAELPAHPRFNVPVTAESRARRQMYQTEETRRTALAASAMDYVDFLRTCDIRLDVSQLGPGNITRVYELSQRTNQLNVSGVRYTREQLAALDPAHTFVLSCRDKFGEYGIIGFAILEEDELTSFFMSCRVQRKRVEEAFFAFLCDRLRAASIPGLRIRYRRTARNQAATTMLGDLGFEYREMDEEGGYYLRSTGDPFDNTDVVKVCATPSAVAAE